MVGIPMEVDGTGGHAADLMSAPPADMAAPQQIQRATVQFENTVQSHVDRRHRATWHP